MGGKAALLLILGYSTILLTVGLNFNRVSSSASDNSIDYFETTMAKEIAKSGINVASSNISRDAGWLPQSTPYSYLGEDNLAITVKDTFGIKTVTSTAIYGDKIKTVEVKIVSASFSEYAYFSDSEAPAGQTIWWTEKDSVWGPFHTNDVLRVTRHPYFDGPTTSHGGALIYKTDALADAPSIVGSYNTGVNIAIPTDGIAGLKTKASSGGFSFSGQPTVFMQFAGDSIKYKFNSTDPFTTVLATDLSSNGTIFVDGGDLRISGTVEGRWSIGSNQSVYIDDDVTYQSIPDYTDKYDPSNDLLGILAKDNVVVTDNAANSSSVNIHAAIYTEEGGFHAEYYDTRSVSGSINLIGGITQKTRLAVGTFDSVTGASKTGFRKNYKYDSRLMRMVPPYYPSTNTFRILSWLE
ncbi:MAG: DUF4900 domain-containing protein [Ignavibacteriae bacterium]|nr:DUF4900 domain-containing protein [Ignavibacteriota bacterium]